MGTYHVHDRCMPLNQIWKKAQNLPWNHLWSFLVYFKEKTNITFLLMKEFLSNLGQTLFMELPICWTNNDIQWVFFFLLKNIKFKERKKIRMGIVKNECNFFPNEGIPFKFGTLSFHGIVYLLNKQWHPLGFTFSLKKSN